MFISCGHGGPTFLISMTDDPDNCRGGFIATLELPQSQIKFDMHVDADITLEEFMLDAMDLSMDNIAQKCRDAGIKVRA